MDAMKNTRKQVVVAGAGFAGLTAASLVKRGLGDGVNVTVYDRHAEFTFLPSLIWVPFGGRSLEDIQVRYEDALAPLDICFEQAEILRVDPAAKMIETELGKTSYDYLIVATGSEPNFAAVPGLGPDAGFTQSVLNARHAAMAARAWQEFLKNPGPVVIGAAQGASFLPAAYEFAFNLAYALRRGFLRHKVQITFVTPEPFLGHLGLGGVGRSRAALEWYFRHADIDWITDAELERVEEGKLRLRKGALHRSFERAGVGSSAAGSELEFAYAMIMPPLLGSEAVRLSGLGNERGYVATDEYGRDRHHPEILAAGVAAAISPSGAAAVPVPKSGYLSQTFARNAAKTVISAERGWAPVAATIYEKDLKCVLDAGDQGVVILSDHAYAPSLRRHPLLLPGWWGHWAKVAFERYYLWKVRTGRLHWP